MYAQDVPIINGAMRGSPAVLRRGIMFAVLSARVPFLRVPALVKDVRQRKRKSNALWGFKLQTYLYLEDHINEVFEAVTVAEDPIECMIALTRVPGLGINKAGFVCQMLGFDIACLDTRNNARLGVKTRKYRAHHKAHGARYAKLIAEYVSETAGRAEELWDRWCEDVAHDNKTSPEKISRMHVDMIVPPALRGAWCDVRKYETPDIPF